jgi:uncharacterized protein (TIGR02246 family)
MSVSKVICMTALAALMPIATWADDSADKKAIVDVLKGYEKALNASNAEEVSKLFTADVVVMAPHHNPAEGRKTIHKVYDGLFKAVRLHIKFEVDEVTPVSNDWAFARTRSKFTVKVVGSDVPPQEDANQELFVLQKEDGKWRIARYSYSSTNPPPKPAATGAAKDSDTKKQ